MSDDDDDLETAFDLALRDADGDFRRLLLSIQAQHEERGTISPRQRQIVEEAAERYIERHEAGRIRRR
jgi:hypothetical protein